MAKKELEEASPVKLETGTYYRVVKTPRGLTQLETIKVVDGVVVEKTLSDENFIDVICRQMTLDLVKQHIFMVK